MRPSRLPKTSPDSLSLKNRRLCVHGWSSAGSAGAFIFAALFVMTAASMTLTGCSDDTGVDAPAKITQADVTVDGQVADSQISDEDGTGTDTATVPTTLCDPCKDNAACEKDNAGAVCVVHGDTGAFCGSTCAADTDCASGYACKDAKDIDGKDSKQCIPKADEGDGVGTCGCSKAATDAALSTLCAVTAKDNDGSGIGTCKGERACGESGLSACSAAVPTADKCDGVDNDCNGNTDDGASCDDANPCTNDSCGGKDGCKSGICKKTGQ